LVFARVEIGVTKFPPKKHLYVLIFLNVVPIGTYAQKVK